MNLHLSLIFAAWLTLLSACGQSGNPVQLNVGATAPAFASVTPEGQAVAYSATKGQPTVLRFWADWCKYCEGEMKALAPVIDRHPTDGLVILAVNVGQDKNTIAAFMKKLEVPYPALLDENAAIAKQYGVVGLPTTYFVDRAGIIQAKIVGEADAATFERQLQSILPTAK